VQCKRAIRNSCSAGAAIATGAVVVLAGAPSAEATVVDVNYSCASPIGTKKAVTPVDIKSTRSGSGYKLTMTFQKGVSSSPIELGKGAISPSGEIKLGAADSGTVQIKGAPNDKAIPANQPIKLGDMTGTYTPKKSGKVTFTASTLSIKAMGTETKCTVTNNPKPSLQLDVKSAGGAGDSPSSGADDGGSDLPQTGPADSAVALGTLGGTVLLVGVAGGLWLTRRRKQA
jgi:LPXTG-motif cell wall-anchored protein